MKSEGLQKETLTQVLYCEYCEILKNSFFHRALPVAVFLEMTLRRRHLTQLKLHRMLYDG